MNVLRHTKSKNKGQSYTNPKCLVESSNQRYTLFLSRIGNKGEVTELEILQFHVFQQPRNYGSLQREREWEWEEDK